MHAFAWERRALKQARNRCDFMCSLPDAVAVGASPESIAFLPAAFKELVEVRRPRASRVSPSPQARPAQCRLLLQGSFALAYLLDLPVEDDGVGDGPAPATTRAQRVRAWQVRGAAQQFGHAPPSQPRWAGQDRLEEATEALSECIAYPRVRATRERVIKAALHARGVRRSALAAFQDRDSGAADSPSRAERQAAAAARQARLRVLGEGGQLQGVSAGSSAGAGSGSAS